jgi:hypothetical protein
MHVLPISPIKPALATHSPRIVLPEPRKQETWHAPLWQHGITPTLGELFTYSVDAPTWHDRFCHQSHKALVKANDMYDLSLPQTQLTHDRKCVCLHCMNGKSRRTKAGSSPNSRSIEAAAEPLDRLHCDIRGPMSSRVGNRNQRVRAMDGSLYYLMVVDEKTGYWWVFPIKRKNEVPSILRDLTTALRTQFGKMVKEIHSDGGGEFVNTALIAMCGDRGIKLTYTTPDSPFHNSLVERPNGLHGNMIRSVLSHSGARPQLWGEAATHCCYVHNRTPIIGRHNVDRSKAVTTPYEGLNGRAPDISKLRVFGCNAHIVIPKHARGKLDLLTEAGVYLGVDEQQNCFRILSPSKLTLVYTRDAKFNEGSFEHLRSVKPFNAATQRIPVDNYWDVLQESGKPRPSIGDDDSDSEDHADYPEDIIAPSSGVLDLTHHPSAPSDDESDAADLLSDDSPPTFPPPSGSVDSPPLSPPSHRAQPVFSPAPSNVYEDEEESDQDVSRPGCPHSPCGSSRATRAG